MTKEHRKSIDAGWPPHFREAFERASEGFSSAKRARHRGYFCGWLRFLEQNGLGSSAESFSRFQSELEQRKKPKQAREYIRCLAWLILEMGLKEHPPEVVTGLTPIRVLKSAKPAGTRRNKCIHSVRWEDWPDTHRARWQAGFQAPAEDPANRYAKARLQGLEEYAQAQAAAEIEEGDGWDSNLSAKRKPRHPSKWTERTAVSARETWSMWLKTAQDLGFDPDDVSDDTINIFIDRIESRGVSGTTLETYLGKLRHALAVMRPGEDWPYLRNLRKNYKLLAEPSQDKLEKLIPLTDLYDLGVKLMAEADAAPPAIYNAVRYRDGLLIALLTQRPKRRRNIAEMRVGQELDLDEDGTPVGIATERTKSAESRYVSFPDLLKDAMIRYLTWHRPFLAKDGCDALWVASTGQPLRPNTIRLAISGRTREHFGVAINPHMFRTIFATWFGMQDPDLLEDVSEALDHKDHRSVAHYQAIAESGFGAAQLNNALQAIKEQDAKDRKKRRRRHSKARRQMAET